MKVKALSFRQPWAELILRGIKTLDLRTWTTRHRGPLAIYASKTVEREACRANGVDAGHLITGAVAGVADLVDIVELDEASYHARTAEHRAGRPFRQPMYGWELANPRWLLEPAPARGRLRLFEVDLDEEERLEEGDKGRPAAQTDLAAAEWDPEKPFELRVVRETNAGQSPYRLALFQRLVQPPVLDRVYSQGAPTMERVVELGGHALRAVADQVLEALRENDYKATDLRPGRREPFLLSEESGVRLGLLFLAVRPLTKMERVEAISHGIRAMTSEELYYWYSKCTGGPAAERAQKALRVLLAAD